MVIGVLLSWAWVLGREAQPGNWIAIGVVALLVIGVVDDRFGIAAGTKFALQAAIASFTLALDGSLVYALGELLPSHDVHMAAVGALALTVFGAVGLINGMNMLDGIDGLAGAVALVAFGWFSVIAWHLDAAIAMSWPLSIAGAIVAFLLFNARLPGRARARVFMGDAGSMVLGFLLAWVAIHLSQRPLGMPAAVALWICALPILDTTAVMAKRQRERRPLMSAGRDHFHHLLLAARVPVPAVAIAESLLGALAGGVGIALWQLGFADWQICALFLAAAAVYLNLVRAGWKALPSTAGRLSHS